MNRTEQNNERREKERRKRRKEIEDILIVQFVTGLVSTWCLLTQEKVNVNWNLFSSLEKTFIIPHTFSCLSIAFSLALSLMAKKILLDITPQ